MLNYLKRHRYLKWLMIFLLVGLGVMLIIKIGVWTDNMQLKKASSTRSILDDKKGHFIKPQTEQAQKIDQSTHQNGFSGTLLVVKNGQVILNKGYGKLHTFSAKPNTTATKYPIASLTKNITAVMVMKYLNQNGYDGSTKLSTFYPNLEHADKVTIRQLITMNAKYEVGKYKPKQLGNEKAYIQGIVDHLYYNATQPTWHYNANDYHLLVGILQQLTGKSYEALLQQTFSNKYEISNLSQYAEAKGRRPLGSTVQGIDVPFKKQAYQKELGTGDVFMNTWGLYQLLESEINHKVVNTQQFSEISKPMPEYHEIYSGGLYSEDNDRAYFCRGVMQGFEDYVYMSKDGKNAVILQSNQYSVTGKNSNLAKSVYGKVVGHDVVFKNY